ncbi:hypothetical protein COU19_01400 [Candidatus Kaiserbacteria bacterium CG10_big_fil_rev_8_21_14_0_10_56_12]|uniref:RlpA-like protein double-psi beta-barrel domain-containing protein n=1 Tax=Candidatus Kaiserbacteria bacterium CG10_big_fil_rev_8_21_14_0_10_56_12 TaxID=1974611 RepID=A0A2H0U9Y9_9BACT|nr:MAG: hypothetical protein COU19_01400 [Candidatus Kaiserbacteria bacterium CG10_big_fil_rev_8_21_14_0_10_56_12]
MFVLCPTAVYEPYEPRAVPIVEPIVVAPAVRTGVGRDAYRPVAVSRKTVLASYYAMWFDGRRTANGKPFSVHDPGMIACPSGKMLNKRLRITNPKNGKVIYGRCDDIGPDQKRFPERGLDLSPAGFDALGIDKRDGLATLVMEVLK